MIDMEEKLIKTLEKHDFYEDTTTRLFRSGDELVMLKKFPDNEVHWYFYYDDGNLETDLDVVEVHFPKLYKELRKIDNEYGVRDWLNA